MFFIKGMLILRFLWASILLFTCCEGSETDLLADLKFKSFIDEFNDHLQYASQFSLDVKRQLNTQYILSHNTCLETVHRIENIEVTGLDGNRIPIRIYVPNEHQQLPMVIYFHGGGWVYGNIEQSDA